MGVALLSTVGAGRGGAGHLHADAGQMTALLANEAPHLLHIRLAVRVGALALTPAPQPLVRAPPAIL